MKAEKSLNIHQSLNLSAEFSNRLYYGDNLTIMKNFPDAYVDLIYLDPPFNSKRTYNLMYKNMVGEPVPEQVEAFCDCWDMDTEKYDLMDNMPEIIKAYHMDSSFIAFWHHWMKALEHTQPKLLAYLIYMFVRLLEMRRILKPTGSIYYHCDPTASHYIKIIMDGVFGPENFRNEIVWHYNRWANIQRQFQAQHDILLFYSKSKSKNYFETLKEAIPEPRKRNLVTIDKTGKKVSKRDEHGKIIYRIQTDRPLSSCWLINRVGNNAKERLGYETQKPIPLLNRLIQASCPAGGIVLDPFCGCGTTVYSAHLNHRKWIGIDIAILSTRLVQGTLKNRYQLEEGKHYEVDGIPVNVAQARVLWHKDKFQFQNWAVEYVDGFCANKKTSDGGADGRKYFKEHGLSAQGELKSMIISVKGGKLITSDVRDLIGTVEKEGTTLGGLISFDEPSAMMKAAAAQLGMYTHIGGGDKKIPRIQFLAVKEIIAGQRFNMPENINRKDLPKESNTSQKWFPQTDEKKR